ncbi:MULTISPECIES: RNA polymerase sigma factor [unclassified Flavobacterium]|uniref:RNA polymerase sigma factor n=1 Tax=unclassified Flavobacterium TaxID=196869 RepID=UPI0012926727|nr:MULTISPECIES: RNA polymerase sigma factor [unclassified Flavobacterium]MQP53231.1 sigma-70 family RNA polymerase sigma factor [Flavobacterium sp. LMO9]MQP62938.1 sigma-70 family RNA polymerase sigma factor [Flavobacterium sp. LMO6]
MNNNSMLFITIYNQYKVLVYNVALNYVQNIEDAEEITQDVFIKVSENVSNFKENSTFKTWIYRITINQSLDYIKKKNSKKRFFVFGRKSENEHELLNTSNFEHPGILLEKQEDAKILFQVINLLPENQKTAFILSKVDGLSNTEVSEIMQMSISAIESLIFRAKNNLKENLSNNFDAYRKKKK